MTTHMLLVSDGSLPLVHAELRYRCVDPFAVQLRLSLGRFQAVSWTFSRDLLIAGIRRPSGIGDVRIHPGGDGVLIELRSTIDPHALLLADRLHLEQFLGHTLSIVPTQTHRRGRYIATRSLLNGSIGLCAFARPPLRSRDNGNGFTIGPESGIPIVQVSIVPGLAPLPVLDVDDVPDRQSCWSEP